MMTENKLNNYLKIIRNLGSQQKGFYVVEKIKIIEMNLNILKIIWNIGKAILMMKPRQIAMEKKIWIQKKWFA